MKFTDILLSETHTLWDLATEKEFLTKMAKGTLEQERYKEYMLQDYYYLVDYKRILEKLTSLSDDAEISEFIKNIMEEIEFETSNVHIPALKSLGIKEDEINNSQKNPVISEYMGYYDEQISKNGLLAGLVALLQCSWGYAYIGSVMYEQYYDDIEKSVYKPWFDAYVSDSYTDTNKAWIDLVDKKVSDVDDNEKKKFCGIFYKCAEYENRFWDSL